MSLLIQLSSIVYDREEVVGAYDDQAQMWSTYANISSLAQLPVGARTGDSSTSAGSEDDTKT
jgi:hypothetical protein